jgi:hypothetical protein
VLRAHHRHRDDERDQHRHRQQPPSVPVNARQCLHVTTDFSTFRTIHIRGAFVVQRPAISLGCRVQWGPVSIPACGSTSLSSRDVRCDGSAGRHWARATDGVLGQLGAQWSGQSGQDAPDGL